MRFIRFLIVLVLITLPLIGLVWLLDREFVFRGVWTIKTGFGKESRFIKVLSPFLKAQQEHDIFLDFEEMPAYFKIATSKLFEKVNFKLKFKTDAPSVEVGIIANEDLWQIKTKTIYNQGLEKLDWQKMEEKGDEKRLVLWQRKPVFKTITDFLENPPPPEKIMTLNYNLKPQQELANYKPSVNLRTYNINLRGPQTIWTYLEDENFNWHFYFQDMNRHDGADQFKVRVINTAGEVIFEQEVSDDGEIWGSGKPSAINKFEITKEPKTGLYKIQINAPDDIFIRKFETNQSKFVFQYTIYLADSSGFAESVSPVSLFGQTKQLTLRTPHKEGKQKVKINKGEQSIEEVNKQYPLLISEPMTDIFVPYPDLKIDFNGFLTFNKENFFLPKPIGFKDIEDLEIFGIDYLIGEYQPPIIANNWLETTVDFNLEGVKQDDGVKLLIRATDRGNSVYFYLTNLEVTFYKQPFDFSRGFDNLFKRIKNDFQRLHF